MRLWTKRFNFHWHILWTFFESWNNLNLKLQGNNSANIPAHHDAIKVFYSKIKLWKRLTQAQTPNSSSFPTFSPLAENEGFQELCKEDAKNKIVSSGLPC